MAEERERAAEAELLFAHWALRIEDGAEEPFEDVVAAHPQLAAELREMHEEWRQFAPILAKAAPGLVSMDSRLEVPSLTGEFEPPTPASDPLLARLRVMASSDGRYKFRAVLGRGGGGVVLKVWDSQLRRPLAMKVVLGAEVERPGGQTPQVDDRTLTRFVDEARIASQLNHPGIVPVHELGSDESGRAFFTMKLVKGETFARVIEKVRRGEDSWNTTRALNVLLRVCEAMAYAHDRGVIHRDLKPANVMVGPYGEVYVMDWGLARVLRAQDNPSSDEGALNSLRRELREETPNSPLETAAGQVVGTPAYMSPEQAHGESARIGAQTDVYAIGAMIYHLLSGAPPYSTSAGAASPRSTLRALREGPPAALERIARGVPPQLAAICERAMARELDARYPNVQSLAEDLRAFLERRVVGAYESGAWAEARSWVRRNRQTALWMAAFALAVSTGGALSSWKAVEAAEARDDAQRRAMDVLSLSAQFDLDRLLSEAETLWPPTPELIGKYEDWLARFRALVDGPLDESGAAPKSSALLEQHRERLRLIRSRALVSDPASETREKSADEPVYENSTDAWWDRQLAALIRQLEAVSNPDSGLAGHAVHADFGWGIAKRLEFARSVEERTITGAAARRLWDEAISAIEDSPRYDALRIPPQLGLLPLGPDPQSGLWEFAHLMSGEPPERGDDGKLVLREESSIVLILIPDARYLRGSQSTSPLAPNFAENPRVQEGPVHEVSLSPYFVGKYEVTQGQWLALTGANPSFFTPQRLPGGNLLHPVEQVNWNEVEPVLGRAGLSMPTEAQWEYAAGAGAPTMWWCGATPESVRGAANLADKAAADASLKFDSKSRWTDYSDGFPVHAPVGSFRPNPLGLHDTIGNVWEWTLDEFVDYTAEALVDPVHHGGPGSSRAPRGGGFAYGTWDARTSNRAPMEPTYSHGDLGVRAARALER